MLNRMQPAQMIVVGALVMAGASYFVCEGDPLIVWVLAALIALPLILTRRHEQSVTLALVAALSASYAYVRLPRPSLDDLSHFAGTGDVRFLGKVVSIHQLASDEHTPVELKPVFIVVAARQLISPFKRNLDGRVSVAASVPAGYIDRLGKRGEVEIFSSICLPEKTWYPWEFETSKFLARQHIFCQAKVSAKQIKLVDDKVSATKTDFIERLLDQGQAVIDWLRNMMLAAHRKNLGARQGDLLSSMVLGQAAVGLDEGLEQLFRETGLSHLLAASGFNLTIVVGSVYFIANALFKNSFLIGIPSMTSIFGFVLLAGPSPSVVRAAITCTFVIIARCFYRRLNMGSALACALILAILFDPDCVTDIGLQLSYAATAAILMGAKQLSTTLKSIIRWKVFAPMCDLVAVILIAQGAVLPLQAAYFWQIGLLFLPANLIVDPLIAPVTCLGFLSSLVAVVPPFLPGCDIVCSILDRSAGVMLSAIVIFLKYITSFGETQLHGAPSVISVLFYWLAAISLLVALKMSKHLKLAAVAYLAALTYLLLPPSLPALTLAVSTRQITLIDSERQFVNVWQSGEDRNMSRFLLYHGVSTHSSACRNFIAEQSTCGVSSVYSRRFNMLVCVLNRSPCEIDGDEAAAFVNQSYRKSSGCNDLRTQSEHRSLIVYRKSGNRSNWRDDREAVAIAGLADKIGPGAAVLCVQPAGRSNAKNGCPPPTLSLFGGSSLLKFHRPHVARAVLVR